jgi:hypothetical protein
MPLPSGGGSGNTEAEGALKRAQAKGAAESKGAAAIFEVIALPGNMRNVLYPARTKAPIFALGMKDGYAIRDLIGHSRRRSGAAREASDGRADGAGTKERARVGALPGATDETIYIMAHRDG